MTIEEIAKKHVNGEPLTVAEMEELKDWLKERKIDLRDFNKIEKVLLEEQNKDKEFESKSLSSQDTEILLENYNKYLEELNNKEKALKKLIDENPLLQSQSIKKLIEAKSRLIAEEKKADQILIKAAEIVDRGKVDEKKALEIAEKIVESDKPHEEINKFKGEVADTVIENTLGPIVKEITVEREIEEANKVIEQKKTEVVEKVTKKIQEVFPEKKAEEIKPIIEEKINEAIEENISLTETNLSYGLVTNLGVSADEEKIKPIIQEASLSIEKQRNEGELGKYLNRSREKTSWREIYVGMLNNGKNRIEAANFAEEMEPSVQEINICREALDKNGYSPNNEAVIEQTITFKHLLESKTNFSDSLEIIGSIKKNLNKIGSLNKKITNWERFQEFTKDTNTIRSVEDIQQLVRRNNLINKVIGQTDKYKKKVLTNLVTHFAEKGFPRSGGDIKGTIAAIKMAIKGVKTASTTGGGIYSIVAAGTIPVVGWVLLGAKALVSAGKWLWNKGKNFFENISNKVGLKSGELLAGIGSAILFGISGITGLISAIPALLASVTVSSKLLVVLLLAIPIYNTLHTMDRMASPLVMNLSGEYTKYTKDNAGIQNKFGTQGNSNYIPGAPGLPGMYIEGECSVADKVVLTKQCDPSWGNMTLNGPTLCDWDGSQATICKAGCGPTSISMILRHQNQSYTPNTVIYGPLNGQNSPYSGMGCEGSDFDQAERTLAIMGIKSKYQGICTPEAIAKWICDGKKIVMVRALFYMNNSGKFGGHYVLAVGVKDGKIITADPYYNVNTPFDGGGTGHITVDGIKGCLTIDTDKL